MRTMNGLNAKNIRRKSTREADLQAMMSSHFLRYPDMELQDMIKLLYQENYGGGHLIKNRSYALKRLIEEMDRIKTQEGHMLEALGENICRLDLHAVKGKLRPETINGLFVDTANTHIGTDSDFEAAIRVLEQMILDGSLPYDLNQLQRIMADLRDKNYPPMHHSHVYNKTYQPAYRLISKELTRYLQVFMAIDRLMISQSSITIAIDGMCGAGKSTLAHCLKEIYDCNLFHMDHFYLPEEKKTSERLSQAGGNVDFERFKSEIILPLRHGQRATYNIFDCQEQKIVSSHIVDYKTLNIIEGSYSMHPALIDDYDLKIFLTVDEEIQISRILARNGSVLAKRFESIWIPLENEYFKATDLKAQVDLVLDTSTF